MALLDDSPPSSSVPTLFKGSDWSPWTDNPLMLQGYPFSSEQTLPSPDYDSRPPSGSHNSCPNLPAFSQASLWGPANPDTCLELEQEERGPQSDDCPTPVIYDNAGFYPRTAENLTQSAVPLNPTPPLARSYSESHLVHSHPRADMLGTMDSSTTRSSFNPSYLQMTPMAASMQYHDSGTSRAAIERSMSVQSLSSSSTDTSSGLQSPFIQFQASTGRQYRDLPRTLSSASLSSSSLASSVDNFPQTHALQSASPTTANHPPFPLSLQKTSRAKPSAASGSPAKKSRQTKLSDFDRKHICEYSRDHPDVAQEQIGAKFGVDRSTISKVLKEKQRWLAVVDVKSPRKFTSFNSAGPITTKAARACRFPQIEDEVILWARDMTRNGEQLTDAKVKEHALAVAAALQIPFEQFKASHGWMDRFKLRAGISNGRIWLGDEAAPPSPFLLRRSTTSSTSTLDDDSSSVFSGYPEETDNDMSSSMSSVQPSDNGHYRLGHLRHLSQSSQGTPASDYATADSAGNRARHRPAALFSEGNAPGYRTIYSASKKRLSTPVTTPLTPESPTFFTPNAVLPPSHVQPEAMPPSAGMPPNSRQPWPPTLASGQHQHLPRRATISEAPGRLADVGRSLGPVQLPEALQSLQVIRQFLDQQPDLATYTTSQAISELHSLLSRVTLRDASRPEA